MKTTENTSSATSRSAKPFFNKSGDEDFFSPSQKEAKPFFSPSTIQAKLAIGEQGDQYEQEADSVADKVVQKLESPQASPKDTAIVSGQSSFDSPTNNHSTSFTGSGLQLQQVANEDLSPLEEEATQDMKEGAAPIYTPPQDTGNQEEQKEQAQPSIGTFLSVQAFPAAGIQRKEASDSIPATSGIESKLSSSNGQGTSLPADTLHSMEGAFGTDFKDVRLHTGQDAVQMNQQLGAQAFTHGQNIYFNKGKLNPGTKAGKHLLAHELTHTIQQSGAVQKKENPAALPISKINKKNIQALPAVTGITVPTEIGVGRSIRASAVLAPGTSRRTRLTWALVGAPAGVTAPTTGRRIRIRASDAALAGAGTNFQIRCHVTGTPADTFTSPNITLVGVTGVTFTAAPAFANQLVAWGASQPFPPNTADPNRHGVTGNTAVVNIVTTPAGRPTTTALRRRKGATVAGNIVTPGRSTGTAIVRVTDNATRSRRDENLVINPIPLNLRRFTAQVASPSGTYGAWNTIGWTPSDRTGTLDRVVGETITAGARDDFGYTASINAPTGPNPAPTNTLAAPANGWADNLFTGSGATAGAAGDANMINLNRYVGPGVAARLPRIWILRQGFHWQSWTGAWSTEIDHGTHRRSLRKRGPNYIFRTEHRFPRANSRVWNEPYVGPPLINLSNIAVTPAVPLADNGLAADGVATANVTVATNVPGRLVNWTVERGTPAFTAGAAAGPVGAAATLQASATPGRFRLRAADTVFPNRRVEANFHLRRVRFRRLRPAIRNVPTGTLSTTVSLNAAPGGRTVNWAVDATALAAGVTVAPVVNPINLQARSATVTRPAGYTGRVTITATDSVLAGVTASTRVRFR